MLYNGQKYCYSPCTKKSPESTGKLSVYVGCHNALLCHTTNTQAAHNSPKLINNWDSAEVSVVVRNTIFSDGICNGSF